MQDPRVVLTLWFVASLALYVLVALSLYPVLGHGVLLFTGFPVLVGALLGGMRPGLLAATTCIGVNLVLHGSIGGIETTPFWVAGVAPNIALLVVGGLVGHLRDVRLQLRAELDERARVAGEVRASEARWRSLLENAPDIIMMTERDGTIDFLNRAGSVESTGYAVGRTMIDQVPCEYRNLIRSGLDRVFELRETFEVLIPGEPSQTSERHYRARFGPCVENGVVVAAIVFYTDVTEYRQLEELRGKFIEKVVAAQEDERRRIARELHDATGQTLTSLLISLRVVEDMEDLASVRQKIRDLRTLTSTTINDIGRLARGLHPSVLDDLGFVAALEHGRAEFVETWGVDVDLQLVGFSSKRRLPSSLEVTLYRIVQEALTNVAKHAEARCVSVIVERQPAHVRVIVEDDGSGCELDSSTGMPINGSGLGLLGIRERAELAGGRLTLESSPGAGTTIYVRIPLPGNEEARTFSATVA